LYELYLAVVGWTVEW